MSKVKTEQQTTPAPTASQPVAKREPPTSSLLGDPYAYMRRFNEELDQLFTDFGFGRALMTPFFERPLMRRIWTEGSKAGWSPQIEVSEKKGKLCVRADLPGIKKDDVKIEVTDEVLTLRGERKEEKEEKKEGYFRSERSYGHFVRVVPLPEGTKTDTAAATFKDGVLEITMNVATREQPKGRHNEIKGA
jgi:HSP20 family protein